MVPVFDYNKIYKDWWHKTLENKPDVCWPGKIKYYALSSGTSEVCKQIHSRNKRLVEWQ